MVNSVYWKSQQLDAKFTIAAIITRNASVSNGPDKIMYCRSASWKADFLLEEFIELIYANERRSQFTVNWTERVYLIFESRNNSWMASHLLKPSQFLFQTSVPFITRSLIRKLALFKAERIIFFNVHMSLCARVMHRKAPHAPFTRFIADSKSTLAFFAFTVSTQVSKDVSTTKNNGWESDFQHQRRVYLRNSYSLIIRR